MIIHRLFQKDAEFDPNSPTFVILWILSAPTFLKAVEVTYITYNQYSNQNDHLEQDYLEAQK
jgi:hypothetical protein